MGLHVSSALTFLYLVNALCKTPVTVVEVKATANSKLNGPCNASYV